MLPLIDPSEKLTVDNTAYDSDHVYSLTAKGSEYIKIIEVSLAFDSNFVSSGSFNGSFRGNSITSQNSVSGDVNVSNGFSIPFGADSLVFLEPNESLEFKFKISSGSGTAQVLVTGVRMTRDEYLREMRRLGQEASV